MNIKKTLQGWEDTLAQEAKEGNQDTIEILDWMKKNRWLRSQRQQSPKPYLQGVKPKIEV